MGKGRAKGTGKNIKLVEGKGKTGMEKVKGKGRGREENTVWGRKSSW